MAGVEPEEKAKRRLDPPFDYVALIHDRAQTLLATFYVGGHISDGEIPRDRRSYCVGAMTSIGELSEVLTMPASTFPNREEHQCIRWPNGLLISTSIGQIRATLQDQLKRLSLGRWVPDRPLMIFSEGTRFVSDPPSIEIPPQGVLIGIAPFIANTKGVVEPIRAEVPIGWALEIDSVAFELFKRAIAELRGQLEFVLRAAPPRMTHANCPDDTRKSSWAPPPGYVGTKEICSHVSYQKKGKNPPRTTIQTWEVLNSTTRIVAPDSREIFYPETWVRERIAKWNPQSPRHT